MAQGGKSVNDYEIRQHMVCTCRKLVSGDLVKGTSGNISVRNRDGLLVTPTGVPYDSIRPEDMVQMSWDGSWDGELIPTSEWRFHVEILRERADLNAVVHTHSPFATAVAILGHDLPAIHYRIAACGGDSVRCATYETFGTQELAEKAVLAIMGRKACLLAHHGVIAGDKSLEGALNVAEIVEEISRLYIYCLPTGNVPVLSGQEIVRVLEKHRTYGQQRRK